MHTKIPAHYELEPRDALQSHPQFASTLSHGLDVLRCFSPAQPLLGNKELAEKLGLTRPTVSRLTFTLVGLGYLRRDAHTGKYTLGPAVLSLGYPLLVHLTLRQLASHDMVELARFARGPVTLGTRDRLQVVYVETVQDGHSNRTRPDIGSTRPLLRTGIGRSLLYAQTPEERELICGRLAQEFPDEWERFSPSLAKSFEEIDRLGFCVVNGDWQPDLCGIACPMRYRSNDLPLAFNITISAHDMDRAYVEKTLGPRLHALVKNLEYRMGIM
ncbi:IclR family transcriptional regulator [Bordetella petrii]|uniref:IclR family transcriptional regulator n=1 Tax=Bordetella petrii TaxID=94624 RepID=UPI001E4667A5|nr:IclR family transcriptional regulator [Bordetella petrii]MCD0503572.1 IclR family transcriptional regulator [Bordetella petrii]